MTHSKNCCDSPSVAAIVTGAYLRDLRHRAGLTLEEVAASLSISASTLSRAERGHRTARPDIPAIVAARLGQRPAAIMREMRSLHHGGDWHHAVDLSGRPLERLRAVQACARSARVWITYVWPAALTSPAEHRRLVDAYKAMDVRPPALLAGHQPPPEDDQLPAGTLTVLIEDSLLARAGQTEQLAHVLALAEERRITLRVVPIQAGITVPAPLTELHLPHSATLHVTEDHVVTYLSGPDTRWLKTGLDSAEAAALPHQQGLDAVRRVVADGPRAYDITTQRICSETEFG
ncbi:Scr1 family TA system antitoxin-like transcriptional regulator [Streptomyces sp. RFCAC02]|uniref:Scr1 family TA system antitoxin-like transcriptional regulator n=1 Tax=Streptomyces sp. RFCAC02 TaxID=2499143 RepID=UPI00143D5539|nr:Scr1 family TA system antitoxin-like transcriptional regulator [Streptomyces sp. RFCAC02]